MAIQLTDAQKKLLVEGTNFVHFATVNKDGSPQVTPVWVDFDGTHVLVNSEEKRRKVRNVKRDPRIALNVLAPGNPYQYTEYQSESTRSARGSMFGDTGSDS